MTAVCSFNSYFQHVRSQTGGLNRLQLITANSQSHLDEFKLEKGGGVTECQGKGPGWRPRTHGSASSSWTQKAGFGIGPYHKLESSFKAPAVGSEAAVVVGALAIGAALIVGDSAVGSVVVSVTSCVGYSLSSGLSTGVWRTE